LFNAKRKEENLVELGTLVDGERKDSHSKNRKFHASASNFLQEKKWVNEEN